MVDDGKRIALHNLNSCSTLFIAECVSGEMSWYGKGKGNGWGRGGGGGKAYSGHEKAVHDRAPLRIRQGSAFAMQMKEEFSFPLPPPTPTIVVLSTAPSPSAHQSLQDRNSEIIRTRVYRY